MARTGMQEFRSDPASAPIAEATSCTFAPTASHRSATFMAKKALAAYLASSADSRLTKRMGALRRLSGR